MDKEFYNALYDLSKQFNPPQITNKDIKLAITIAQKILSINTDNKLNYTDEIPILDLINSPIDIFYEINCKTVSTKCYSIISNLHYMVDESSKSCEFITYSSITNTAAATSKKAQSIVIPSKITETSKIFFTHEISHILKESNYKECQNIYSLNEMIPILLELIYGYNSHDYKLFKDIINQRIYLLKREAKAFISIINEINKINKSNIPKYLYSALGSSLVYILSFYYSISLFNIYMQNNNLIIYLIENVLLEKIDSKELLNICKRNNIITSFEEEFNDGLNIITK